MSNISSTDAFTWVPSVEGISSEEKQQRRILFPIDRNRVRFVRIVRIQFDIVIAHVEDWRSVRYQDADRADGLGWSMPVAFESILAADLRVVRHAESTISTFQFGELSFFHWSISRRRVDWGWENERVESNRLITDVSCSYREKGTRERERRILHTFRYHLYVALDYPIERVCCYTMHLRMRFRPELMISSYSFLFDMTSTEQAKTDVHSYGPAGGSIWRGPCRTRASRAIL